MKNSKNKVLVIISVILIAILIIGATFAYFASQVDRIKTTDIDITADTTDTLVFKTGKELALKATVENFAEGGNNLSASTYAKAILKANSTDNQSEIFHYNVYLVIGENTFQYTTSDKKSELVLNVTGPDGTIFTNKDITESRGLIKIATNREISTTSTLEETFDATVEFKNLSSNQSVNGGAKFQAKLYITSEELTLSEYVKLAYETASEGNIYYHDSNLTNGANDLSYRYSGSDYSLTTKAKSEGYAAIDNDLLLRTKTSYGMMVKYAYNTSKANEWVSNAFAQAVKDGYLKDSNINNFVCFGGDDCSNKDNLYRIIGTFKNDDEYQAKLVKYTPATEAQLGTNGTFDSSGWESNSGINSGSWSGYTWSSNAKDVKEINSTNYYNIWSNSSLNKINLNTNYINYLNNIDTKWVDMISYHDWIVGGVGSSDGGMSNVQEFYDYEINNYNKDIESTYNDRIGLIYVSDYGYAADPKEWDVTMIAYFAMDNWFFDGNYIDTITRISDTNNLTYSLHQASGELFLWTNTLISPELPTFYLNSDVPVISGSGTKIDPYRIVETNNMS